MLCNGFVYNRCVCGMVLYVDVVANCAQPKILFCQTNTSLKQKVYTKTQPFFMTFLLLFLQVFFVFKIFFGKVFVLHSPHKLKQTT